MTPKPWIIALLLLAFPLAACQEQSPATDDLARSPADQVPPPEEDFAEGTTEGTPATEQRITVANPMPHPMIVTATYDGQTAELGTVDARVEGSFYLQVPDGTRVTVQARDSANTHRSDTTFVVGPEWQRWTIR
jgi:hypothetical protein